MKQRQVREGKDVQEAGVVSGFCARNAFKLTSSSCGRDEVAMERYPIGRVSENTRRERETQKVAGSTTSYSSSV
jgi:hypothetical protein